MGRASTFAYLRPVTVGVASPGSLRLHWSRVKSLADLSAKVAASAAAGPHFAADVVEFAATASRLSAEISPFVVTVGSSQFSSSIISSVKHLSWDHKQIVFIAM
jgi:hypothetical protein